MSNWAKRKHEHYITLHQMKAKLQQDIAKLEARTNTAKKTICVASQLWNLTV